MARELALGLVIGGAVSKTVGVAFQDVENRVKKLESTASRARVLQNLIGDTRKLQDEWRKAHTTGAATAESLRRKLDANLDSLRRQGVEVRNLGRAYEQAGRKARAADLKSTGQAQLQAGGAGLRNTALATTGAAAATMIAPTKVSAEYNAMIRDIAIKGGIAGTAEERQMSADIVQTSRDTGLKRNEVADVVNALVGAGMDLKQAMQYAPVAAKFVVGQGAEGTDTARMINALGKNAKITDPADMQKALEAIAYQGQAGSFEASDMAKWFPDLLSQMANMGITGTEAVRELGSMLQVQMNSAGSADEAANNLKNWFSKIGSGDTVKAYKDAGIDYAASMKTGLANGKSTLESSFELAQRYVEATDPAKAKAMQQALAKISKESDPAKVKQMMTAFEASMRTGDLFADMQVKAALTAYMQGKKQYQDLKAESANAGGILEKNLAERRETSDQIWKEAAQSMDDALRSAGDAMRPITDKVASSVASVGQSLSELADKSPRLVTGLLGVGAAIATAAAAYSTFKIGKGLMNIGRGTLMGNPNVVQKVHVVNSLGGGPNLNGAGSADTRGRSRRRGGFWRRGSASKAAGGATGADKPRMRVYAGSTAEPKPPLRNAQVSTTDERPHLQASTGDEKPRMRVYADGRPAELSRPLSRWVPPTETPRPPMVPSASGMAGAPVTSLVPTASRPAMALHAGRSEGKGGLAGTLFDAAVNAKEVFDKAETQDEKAEGYGSVAGSAAGTLAGAAAGAAIGSVVPIIGTAIGGAIGAWLGSQGGSALGGYLGKSLFGNSDEAVASKAVTDNATASAPNLNEVSTSLSAADAKASTATLVQAVKNGPEEKKPPPKLEQTITLSPTISVVVQGDAKDPRELVNQMMPEIQRQLTELGQQLARRDMTDLPVF